MYVTSSSSKITSLNVQNWIQAFQLNILPEIQKMETFYNGEENLNKVEDKLDKSTGRPSNIIHSNLAKMIVTNACGYFMGKPVTYAFEDKTLEDVARKLFWESDEQAENQTLAKDASKFGVAYELMGINDDGQLYIKSLSPLNTFFVVDDSILENKICAVTYWTRTTADHKTITKGYVYTKDGIYPFNDKTIEEPVLNPFKPCIPVFEYKNNDDSTGDYAFVTDLLSAYSKLLSTNFDDMDSVANALLVFKNAEMREEEAQKANKTRVVGVRGENADVKYVSKTLDKDYVEYLRKSLRDDIFSITNVPDLTDEKFAGNQSGVALSYKLIGFENLRLTKKNYFEKGLFQRLTCLFNYKKLGNVAEQLPEGSVKITFQTNLPSNIDKDKQYSDLHNAGVLSLETTLDLMESVDDSEEELKRIENEKPNIESLNFGTENAE